MNSVIDGDGQLNIIINSPDKLIWEGKATSVSSENSTGVFDILPGHSNFVTMIEGKPIVVQTDTSEETFKYENAVLSVKGGVVIIYADI